MMPKDNFDPTAEAAKNTKSIPVKKPVNAQHLAALPPLLKDRPIIQPPKKAKADTVAGNESKYWKTHPLLTEHSDGTIRPWGEDTTAMAQQHNPNVLPKQMLPPPSTPQGKKPLELSDKAKGYSNYYYNPNR